MYNYLMLLAGMGSSVYFKFGGTFGFSEIGIFVYSIFNFIYIRKLSKEYCTLIILAIAWLSGIFIADLMNQVKLEDTLKLTGSVFLIIINIYGIFQILKASPKSAYYFVMGNGISNVLQFY